MYVSWSNFKSEMTVNAVKDVTCEKCRAHYAYALTRTDFGTGTSVYGLDDAGAQQRAADQAVARLQTTLANAVEMVPCPNCGFYQSDMSAFLKRAYLKWMLLLGMVMVALSIFGFLFSCFREGPVLLGLSFGLMVVGAGLIVGRQAAAAQYDPNAGDPEPRKQLGQGLALLKDYGSSGGPPRRN